MPAAVIVRSSTRLSDMVSTKNALLFGIAVVTGQEVPSRRHLNVKSLARPSPSAPDAVDLIPFSAGSIRIVANIMLGSPAANLDRSESSFQVPTNGSTAAASPTPRKNTTSIARMASLMCLLRARFRKLLKSPSGCVRTDGVVEGHRAGVVPSPATDRARHFVDRSRSHHTHPVLLPPFSDARHVDPAPLMPIFRTHRMDDSVDSDWLTFYGQ